MHSQISANRNLLPWYVCLRSIKALLLLGLLTPEAKEDRPALTRTPWLGHWWCLWQQRTYPYLTSFYLHPWRHKLWSGGLAASAHSLKKVACYLGPDRAS